MLIPKYPTIGKYIDPLVDFAFKKIFGSELNRDLLIDFLNEVFRGRKMITDLTYGKTDYPGDSKKEGGAIFDLMCTGDKGEQFIIEIQRSSQQFFKERALFYTSRLISGQAPRGNRNKWAYNLKEVYLVALLDGFTLDGKEDGSYLHDIALCDRGSGKIFYEKLGYTYIELYNFTKKEDALETGLDKWLYVLKHLSTMKKLPTYLRKPIFKKLFSIAEYTNMTKEETMKYDTGMKRKWDDYSVMEHAKLRGREEGREEGRKEVRGEEAAAIALALKKEGLSNEFIAKTTKLSIEEIEKL